MGKLRQQFRYSHRPGVVVLEGYITCVAGSPVTATSSIRGISSVTRSDTGDFTLNIDHAYYDVIGFHATYHPIAAAATYFVVPQTLAAATRKTAIQAKTFLITVQTESGTPTDPTATDIIWITLALSKSAATDRA